ncbi:MAG: hypothetical protein Q8R18_03850 [bacterium]|nr:hypothetical protein [bacterium]
MGLEDIVNFLLKPVESLGSIIYDICFTTKIDKVVTKKDGIEVISYKRTYSGSDLQKAFEIMGRDYLGVKEFLMKYTLRPVDTVAVTIYDVIEAPVKALYETLDKKVFTPSIELVKNNPWKVAGLVSLPLALYASSLFYAAGYPLYV